MVKKSCEKPAAAGAAKSTQAGLDIGTPKNVRQAVPQILQSATTPKTKTAARSALAALLHPAAGGDAAFEATVLIEEVCGGKFALLESPPTPGQWQKLLALGQKRIGGYPLQYIVGHWPFMGLELAVGEGVLIPRQDTETVVEAALAFWHKKNLKPHNILDLCSGSGAIAAACTRFFTAAKVTAVENSKEAFFYLRKNAEAYLYTPVEGDVFVYQNTLFENSVDMVVANPPYLTAAEMGELQQEVKSEPAAALFGGVDGLQFYRHIAKAYKPAIAKGGLLLFEIGAAQSPAVQAILAAEGYTGIFEGADLGGNPRYVGGTKG